MNQSTPFQLTILNNTSKNLPMYTVGITRAFNDVFPRNIIVSAGNHSPAIQHYKSASRARQVNSGSSRIFLESAYEFQFHINASPSSRTSNSVRLSLPAKSNRQAVARALDCTNGRSSVHCTGIGFTDPQGVTLTLA